ncbi:M15 family metallopeptidase [Paenibacillus sp. FSL W7-1287]|uniref:M15 family metallopeptidase n=1 Tax=Paenibacillus sp. FSL W7-1287 TaxID=2954538 RepID=UPI0030F5524E
MRMSSFVWRALTVMLLCIVLQACSTEHTSEEKTAEPFMDGQASYNSNETSKETSRAEHLQGGAQSVNEGQKEEVISAVDVEEEQEDGAELIDEAGLSKTEETDFMQHPAEPTVPPKAYELPEGFVYLEDVLLDAEYDLRYYGENNFVGRQVEGYLAPYAIATAEMAEALMQVSDEMRDAGYRLLIYDTYRPAKAVEFFKEWSEDVDDTLMKEDFYPNEDKRQLFKRGYLSKKSGHSRGSTVDLTLVHASSGELVDMGSPYDLLDEISTFATKQITPEQAANRELLKQVMNKHGFKEYSKEWWHYVLRDEPYPTTYFDFDVQ